MARDTILFDINETVLDLASLRPRFEAAFADAGVAATWFSMLLHSSTVCALTGVQTTFGALAGHMLDTLAARRGVTISAEKRQDILSGFHQLQAHSDVIPALETLRRAGYRTVAFTNSSHELVTNQITHSGLLDYYDEIVSVEATGSFKPDGKVYAFAASRLGRPVEALRLVAAHDWDTHGALVAGLEAAYIDRTGAPYHPLYRRPQIFETTMINVARQIIARDGAP